MRVKKLRTLKAGRQLVVNIPEFAIMLRRSPKMMFGSHLVVITPNLNATPYKDIIEVLARIIPVRSFAWQVGDTQLAPDTLVSGCFWILRDIIWWLPLRIKTLLTIRRLHHRVMNPPKYDKHKPPLYMKTDAVFEIKTGGSIAHSLGVVRGFENKLGAVQLLLSAPLPGIDFGTVLEIKYGLGRNIPGLAGFDVNRQFLTFLSEKWETLDPSFIYHRYSLGHYVGALISRKHGVPLVLEYNGSEVWIARHWGGRPLREEKLFSRIEQTILEAADLVVVVSEAMRNQLLDRGIANERILVCPNGVNPEIFHPNQASTEIRQKHGFGNNDIVFGFIGSFGPWHGTDVLTAAFLNLLQTRNDLQGRVHLAMIGDGPALPVIREKLEESEFRSHFKIIGEVPQLDAPHYLAACDVLVLPTVRNPDGSPFFGSPTKLFEYMATGRAIIASDIDQIGEVLKNNETAVLVEPGNVDALAQAMAGGVDLPKNKRLKLGLGARKMAVENPTWDAHVQKIIERLEDLYPCE